MWNKILGVMNGAMTMAERMQQANINLALRGMKVTTNVWRRMWGRPAQDVLPADKRFQHESWSENLAADAMKQSYLVAARWMEEMADGLEPLGPKIHCSARFWTRQFAEAISPSNFFLTNPEVIGETVRTGGANVIRGMKNLLSDLKIGRIRQVERDAFKVGKDLAVTPGKVVYRNALIELIQYAPTTAEVQAVPMLMIPPWINKYYIMDMTPDNSMYKYLIDSGFTVFTISWKNPDKSIFHLKWDDYMDLGVLDAMRVIKAITGAEKVNMTGYCLGGIIQQVTLAYLAAVGDESANTATCFTTHQDFSQAGDIDIFINRPIAVFLDWMMKWNGGYMDGRNMSVVFNMLRAKDLFWNYVVQNYLLGQTPPAFDLLYWNSDSTRVPAQVHSFLVREFFLNDKLKEPGGIQVKGTGVDLSKIKVPTYGVAASGDHIVPWKGAFLMRKLQGGPVRFILSGGGHIAGIINPPGKKPRGYWVNDNPTADAQEWLSTATQHQESWWVDWMTWLKRHSGDKIAPPSMGNGEFAPLMDAPGTYVLEK